MLYKHNAIETTEKIKRQKQYLKNLILWRQPENGGRILRTLIKDMKAIKIKPLSYTKRNIYVRLSNT